jgi:hypothetical protein
MALVLISNTPEARPKSLSTGSDGGSFVGTLLAATPSRPPMLSGSRIPTSALVDCLEPSDEERV